MLHYRYPVLHHRRLDPRHLRDPPLVLVPCHRLELSYLSQPNPKHQVHTLFAMAKVDHYRRQRLQTQHRPQYRLGAGGFG